ncbi:MAG: class I adenylate-forming enzyme family protein [Pseudomonadota bacterium]
MNITDPIWRNCFAWPDRTAIHHDGGSVTYGNLRLLCGLVRMRLYKAGVRRGDCVSVAAYNPFAYIVLALAIVRLGAIVTPIRGVKLEETRDALLRRHDARWVIQDTKENWRSPVLPADAYLQVADFFRPYSPDEGTPVIPVAVDADDDIWLIALSSGTTGTPKSIPHTHAQSALAFSLGRLSQTLNECALVVADMAVYMGFGGAMRALISGATLVVTADINPALLFELIARHRVTRLSTTTALAGMMVAHAERRLPDSRAVCESLNVMTVAGASVPPALREGIFARICPQIEIGYGATELGGMAQATTLTLAARPESAGLVRPWVDAQVVDEDGKVLPPGTKGILRFKSATVVRGYIKDPEATARMFRNGWYYPGDMGSIDDAGYVTLGGRTDHVLNLGGKKLDPVQIENVLNSHPCVTESAVVAVVAEGEHIGKLVAVVVLASPVEKSELQQRCREALGQGMTPRDILFVSELPKNAGGKIMRAELTARVKIPARTDAAA